MIPITLPDFLSGIGIILLLVLAVLAFDKILQEWDEEETEEDFLNE